MTSVPTTTPTACWLGALDSLTQTPRSTRLLVYFTRGVAAVVHSVTDPAPVFIPQTGFNHRLQMWNQIQSTAQWGQSNFIHISKKWGEDIRWGHFNKSANLWCSWCSPIHVAITHRQIWIKINYKLYNNLYDMQHIHQIMYSSPLYQQTN